MSSSTSATLLLGALQAMFTSQSDARSASRLPSSSLQALSALLPDAALALFHSASPKATAAALADLEAHARIRPPSSFPPARRAPQLLAGLATVLTCAPYLAVRVTVDLTTTVSTETRSVSSHVVLLRQLCVDDTGAFRLRDSNHDDGDDIELCEANCDCRAFAFRPSGEAYCKHVIIAAIAAALAVAPVEKMSESQFLDLLETSPQIAT